jgi:gamma-glutamylcyclotransferase
MKARCPGHRAIGVGILSGYHCIISKRWYANIIKSETDEVQGVVYEITEADERSLDNHEGVAVGTYWKEILPVKSAGWIHNCLVYVDPDEEKGKPKS